MSKGTNINTETLTWEATKALMSLDNSFVGTESYMGMSYFWPTDFKHELRDATYAKRRRVHALVLAAGVPVQAGGWLGDPSGIHGVTPFVHEAYRAAIQKVCKGDIGPWHRLAEWEARQPAPEAPEAEEAAELEERREAVLVRGANGMIPHIITSSETDETTHAIASDCEEWADRALAKAEQEALAAGRVLHLEGGGRRWRVRQPRIDTSSPDRYEWHEDGERVRCDWYEITTDADGMRTHKLLRAVWVGYEKAIEG